MNYNERKKTNIDDASESINPNFGPLREIPEEQLASANMSLVSQSSACK